MTDNEAATDDEATDEHASEKAAEPRGDREAAKYRRQLREAQAANEALNTRIETMQRREVQRQAEDRVAVPSDLFTVGGVTLADLLDDDGNVDEGKVTAAVGDLLSARPGLEPRAPAPSFDGGTRTPVAAEGPTWNDVLDPRNARR